MCQFLLSSVSISLANAAAGGHWAVARLIVEGGGDPDDGGWVDGDGAPRNLLEAAVVTRRMHEGLIERTSVQPLAFSFQERLHISRLGTFTVLLFSLVVGTIRVPADSVTI